MWLCGCSDIRRLEHHDGRGDSIRTSDPLRSSTNLIIYQVVGVTLSREAVPLLWISRTTQTETCRTSVRDARSFRDHPARHHSRQLSALWALSLRFRRSRSCVTPLRARLSRSGSAWCRERFAFYESSCAPRCRPARAASHPAPCSVARRRLGGR